MNKLIFASIAAVATALMGSPIRAEAGHNRHNGDEVVAAIGGFIGGVIVGTTINNNNHLPPPRVGVGVSYGHDYGRRHGHWEWTTVRVWVPGRWVYVERDHRRPRRVWMDGYHDHRRERVWVAHRGNRRCNRGCR